MSEFDTLVTKHRPGKWSAVVGHNSVVRSMKQAVADRTSRCFLLAGPSGVGKTTLARIAAKEAMCTTIREVDAATFTGVDDMRQLTNSLHFRPLGGGNTAIILNEVHRLSGNAFDSLLIPLEEPEVWTYWFLTTTRLDKIPAAVQTRCARYILKPLTVPELRDLVEDVLALENIQLPDEAAIVDMCCRHAEGSARAAVANIGACFAVKSKEDARELLQRATEGSAGIDLARALVGAVRWGRVQEILLSLKDEDPEGVRHVVRAYVTTVIMGAKSEKNLSRLFAVLDAFSQPFNRSDGVSPLLLACGRLLFAPD